MTVAMLEREEWTLWSSDGKEWFLMDSLVEKDARYKLERKAAGLRKLFTNRTFVVVYGTKKPGS